MAMSDNLADDPIKKAAAELDRLIEKFDEANCNRLYEYLRNVEAALYRACKAAQEGKAVELAYTDINNDLIATLVIMSEATFKRLQAVRQATAQAPLAPNLNVNITVPPNAIRVAAAPAPTPMEHVIERDDKGVAKRIVGRPVSDDPWANVADR
jgi:hypothetical protein